MLVLRKILLCDILYIFIFLLVLLISFFRINYHYKSEYDSKSKYAVGIVNRIYYDKDRITIYLKNKENLLVTYYSKKNIDIKLGDVIKVFGEFDAPNNNTTKYLFNYKKYLSRRKIFYIIKARKIVILSKNKNLFYFIKQLVINNLDGNPYLYTFLLGDKTFVNKDVMRSYQENGISHLFAISGMHITLLSSIINKLIKGRVSSLTAFKITSIFLLVYLLLVGFSPSILRGVLFYILFNINKIYYFYIKQTNIFLFIISISLLINPYYIFDIGFQYSYLISFSLIMLSDIISSKNYFISLFKTSLVSFFVSIPISIYNYYQLNLLSILYNLIFVPIVSLILFPMSLLVFIFKPFLGLYNFLIFMLEKLSLFFSNVSIGKIVFKRLPLCIYLIYFFIIIFYILFKKKRYVFVLLLFLFFHSFISFFDYSNYVYYLDVGQGDATFIRYNRKSILIDTGGKISNEGEVFNNIIFPFLKSNGIKKLDYYIITHGDYDHMGESINLVENFKVEKVIFNCGKYNYLEKELIKVLDKKNIKYYSCISKLDNLYFLNTKEYDNENDNSNVIYTKLNGYKFMFMGDASVTTEKEILNKYNLPDIDVLKVGHHGSKTSSDKDFIHEINPNYSIISVGKNNRYGHPNKEALKNLKNSKIYRTDEDGSIMFKIKNNKLKIETCSPYKGVI